MDFPFASQNKLALILRGECLHSGYLAPVVKKTATTTSRYGISHDKHSKLLFTIKCWWAAVTYHGIIELCYHSVFVLLPSAI